MGSKTNLSKEEKLVNLMNKVTIIESFMFLFVLAFFIDIAEQLIFEHNIGDYDDFLLQIIFVIVFWLFFMALPYRLWKFRLIDTKLDNETLRSIINDLKKEKVIKFNNVYFIYHGILGIFNFKKVIVILSENKPIIVGNWNYLHTELRYIQRK